MPRLQPRLMSLPATLLGLVMASTLGIQLASGAAPAQQAQPGARIPEPSAAVSEAKARAAAERILQALRSGTAEQRFAQFAPSLQRMTTAQLVQAQIRRQPKVLSWKITDVAPGFDSSTVQAALQTSAGQRELLMVIDANGQLEGYHFNVSDRPAEEVARKFVQAIVEGRYVSASGFLNPDLQLEIPASSWQRKWQKLQTLTGNYVRTLRVNRSESTSSTKLVMVTVEFTRLTENLYVILDSANEIIGVDFPTDPAGGTIPPTSSR